MTALSFIDNRRRASASAVTMSDQVDAAASPSSPREIISIRGSLFTKTSLWPHLAGTLPRTWILSGKIPTQLPVVHNLRASSSGGRLNDAIPC
ncbi:hypothetical protein ALC57_17515 [Trachymyrmex cornetzi]|uniref:Uncharacterized protein n=1 Tax=Trachymyrmex cornetzi TaxID=471704 RepID=A0A195DBR3_9HYME|nr:hypothetical protein ALC57_17515 [Trachymyrmex cornetzi]